MLPPRDWFSILYLGVCWGCSKLPITQMSLLIASSPCSALYVVDLKKFRKIAAGDRLRGQYQGLSQDPNSLSNLDQVWFYWVWFGLFYWGMMAGMMTSPFLATLQSQPDASGSLVMPCLQLRQVSIASNITCGWKQHLPHTCFKTIEFPSILQDKYVRLRPHFLSFPALSALLCTVLITWR